MISPINPRRITPTKSLNIGEMLLLSGYRITVVILILMMMSGLSGDSTTQKQEPIRRLLTPPSVEIRETFLILVTILLCS